MKARSSVLALLALVLLSGTACSRWAWWGGREERTLFSPGMMDVLEDPNASPRALMRVSAAAADYASFQHDESPEPVYWLSRLSALLRRELAEPTLRRPPGAVCPVQPVQGCQRGFDGCTPRAVYIEWVLESLLASWQIHMDEDPQDWGVIREALHRGDARLTPRALEALVLEMGYWESSLDSMRGWQAAVDAHSEDWAQKQEWLRWKSARGFTIEALAALVKELHDEVEGPLRRQLALPSCRGPALSSLRALPQLTRDRFLAPLLELADSQEDPFIRAAALRALSNVDQDEFWAPLRHALESNHSELQLAALGALGQGLRQRHAVELVALLEALKQSTRSLEVWSQAQSVLWRLQLPPTDAPDDFIRFFQFTQAHPVDPPGWLPCPRLKRRGEDLEVELHGETVLLHSAVDTQAIVHKGPCAGVPNISEAELVEPQGPACIVGHSHGEFGGGLVVYEKDSLSVLWATAPVRVARPHGAVVVLDSLLHLGTSGALIWLERGEPGEWRVLRVARLPGAVVSFGYTQDGDLILATFNSSGVRRCPSHDVFSGALFRVGPDGQLVSLQ